MLNHITIHSFQLCALSIAYFILSIFHDYCFKQLISKIQWRRPSLLVMISCEGHHHLSYLKILHHMSLKELSFVMEYSRIFSYVSYWFFLHWYHVSLIPCRFGRKLLWESHHFCSPGLQINDIEPFCQDEIVLYRQCAEKRVSYVKTACLLSDSAWCLFMTELHLIITGQGNKKTDAR